MWAHACEAIAACGDIGRYIATASPSRTPSRTRPSAKPRHLVARARASVNDVRAPSSACQTAASSSGRSAAQRCTQAVARLSRAPVNQVVHSMPRESSSTASQSRDEGDAEVVAHRAPEAVGLLDRHAVERRIVVAAEGAGEARDVRRLELLGARSPRVALRGQVSIC